VKLLAREGWRRPLTGALAFTWHRYRAAREKLTRGRITGYGSWYNPGIL
jgi:hypothetical protein